MYPIERFRIKAGETHTACGDLVILTEKPSLQTSILAADRQILRRLAGEVAALAARPLEEEKRALWYAHNALEPTRPVIFCDPENGWSEIITHKDLQCSGELARQWEMSLRKILFWGNDIKDDFVIEPFFSMPYEYTSSGWGLAESLIGGGYEGSYRWDSPLKSEDDLSKLRYPVITVDYEVSEHLLQLAQQTFGDLLPARRKSLFFTSVGMTETAVKLRGLEQFMYDLIEKPDFVHSLMKFLHDGFERILNFVENNNLLSLNNDGTYVGSGGLGWSKELPAPGFDGHVRLRDMWGFAESQETVGVSPAMFEEFIFPYQLPLLERFGLNCYGCCEPLDKRWEVVKRFPRLRRVSVSAWADKARMVDMLGANYVYSLKPTPADLAMPDFDEERIRRELREVIKLTRNCRVEIIMKDNHTLNNEPQRLVRWAQIAREEAERA